MKNERKSTNNPTTALLILISETKSIKEATIKSNIVVPKSGCIKIKNKLIETPDIASNLLAFWLSILAINNTKIILLNSDGCIKIGNPSGSKSYHRLTPSIGVVKSKPNKTEIESKNNEFINYEFHENSEKPTILFSNSLGSDLNMWNPQVEFFKDILCEYLFFRPTFEVSEANLIISLFIIS